MIKRPVCFNRAAGVTDGIKEGSWTKRVNEMTGGHTQAMEEVHFRDMDCEGVRKRSVVEMLPNIKE